MIQGAGPTDAAEVAYHQQAAGALSQALEWELRAADQAERMPAPAEALQHLERALELWSSVPAAADGAGVTAAATAVRAAAQAALAGEPPLAVVLSRRAMRLAVDDPDGSADLVAARCELARHLVTTDAVTEAVEHAERAVADAAAWPVAGGRPRAVMARSLLAAGRVAEARPYADQALVEARAAGDLATEVEVLATSAFLDEGEGDRDGAAARLAEGLRLAREGDVLPAELRAHFQLASLRYYGGDVAGSLPVLQEGVRRAASGGLRWSTLGIELRVLHVIALYVTGDLAAESDAAEHAEHRPPDGAAARMTAAGCYAAVARGDDGADRRFAALRGSWDTDPQVGLVAGGCEADHLAMAGAHRAAVTAAELAQQHLDRAAGEGCSPGCGCPPSGWLPSVTAPSRRGCTATRRRSAQRWTPPTRCWTGCGRSPRRGTADPVT